MPSPGEPGHGSQRTVTHGGIAVNQEVYNMARVAPYYSINEVKKLPLNRVYHNDSTCRAGRDIPLSERQSGTGGYRLCKDCQ